MIGTYAIVLSAPPYVNIVYHVTIIMTWEQGKRTKGVPSYSPSFPRKRESEGHWQQMRICELRILGSRFRGNDGNRRLETKILELTTLPRADTEELESSTGIEGSEPLDGNDYDINENGLVELTPEFRYKLYVGG